MSFKQYLKTMEGPSIVYSFGRMNPMHNEHYILTQFMVDLAKRKKYQDIVLYTSFSQNQKKNPLYPNDKINFLKMMVPKGVKVSEDTTLKNAFQILEDLIKNKKYTRIAFVVGEDRVKDFQTLYKYAKDWGEEVNSVIDFKIEQRKGSRTKGMSGTDMRQYAKDNDFEKFLKFAPKSLSKKEIQDLFVKTQIGLGVIT